MREPLVELPLDRYIGDAVEARTAQKRPLSPGSTIISPAKRRMLAQGGLAFPSSRVRSPLVDFGAQTSIPTSSSLRVEGVARKLDFGASIPSASRASPAPGGEENMAAEPTRTTRTSPRLAARTTPASSRRAARAPNSKGSAPPLSREATPSPMLVSRDLPTPHNPSSPSHPGFDIPFDTHVEISRSRASVKPPSSRGSSREPDGENKENLRPTRKGRKGSEGKPMSKGKTQTKSKNEDAGVGSGNALRRSPRHAVPHGDVPMDIDC
ncbi:hypothetical protein PENSPDRAFT_189084 [Peniophora sp. CONT]|nr:hypothetical protein PENSPDRAFT_189084 [Peniophora sp. CONT]